MGLTVGACAARAAEWVRECEAGLPGFVGAYIGGSTAAMAANEEIAGGSDMDVYVVLDAPAPEKRGKIDCEGALIEISYVPLSDISPAEKALCDYHIANSLRWRRIVSDADGRLQSLMDAVSEGFSDRKHIIARRDQALSRVRNPLSNLDFARNLPELTLSWLFPTGIMAHAALVSALQNPTIRLRYLRAREALEPLEKLPLYEKMLELSGFLHVPRKGARDALRALEELYDAAAAHSRTFFFFASDVSPQSRATAIDASYALIERGDHRETLFWTITTYARAMRMLLADCPELYDRYLPRFHDVLRLVGRDSEADIRAAAERTLAFLPELERETDGIIGRFCARG